MYIVYIFKETSSMIRLVIQDKGAFARKSGSGWLRMANSILANGINQLST